MEGTDGWRLGSCFDRVFRMRRAGFDIFQAAKGERGREKEMGCSGVRCWKLRDNPIIFNIMPLKVINKAWNEGLRNCRATFNRH